MKQEWSVLKAGTLVAGLVTGLLALCSMGVSAVLARLLPQEQLGGYFLLLQAVTTLGLASTLGTNNALQRLLAVQVARDDWPVARATMLRAAGLTAAGFTAVCVLLAIGWGPLSERALRAPALAPLALLVALLVATQAVDEMVSVFFRATGRTRLGLFLLNLPRQVLFLGLIATIALAGRELDLLGVAWLRVGVTVLTSVLGVGLVWEALRRARGRPVSAAPGTMEILRTSAPILVHVLAATLVSGVDYWLIGIYTGTAEVGVFGAMSQLVGLIAMLLSVVNLVMPPMLASMHAEGRLREMEVLMRRVSTVSAWAVAGAFAVFALLGRDLIGVVFGPDYQHGYAALLVLAAGQAFNVSAGSPGWVLQMTGHQETLMRITLLTTVAKIALAWIAAASFGLIGVAVAGTAMLVVQNVALVVATQRLVGVRTWSRLNPLSVVTVTP